MWKMKCGGVAKRAQPECLHTETCAASDSQNKKLQVNVSPQSKPHKKHTKAP
jgi:hypothetical protein